MYQSPSEPSDGMPAGVWPVAAMTIDPPCCTVMLFA